ncbi:lipid phosphate phosphatase delta-like isoform X2 [Wolffia australiana]
MDPLPRSNRGNFHVVVGGVEMGARGDGVVLCQVLLLLSIMAWVVLSSTLGLTRKIRSLVRPWISRRVDAETSLILSIQRWQHAFLDAFFSAICCVVSVPFYKSEHRRLARQMTLLMAFCVYIGNSVKDMASAPRPRSPPVRRVTATKEEEDNATTYGLPSSHALNTVCLSGFLLHYMAVNGLHKDGIYLAMATFLAVLLVLLIGFGRVYLGMHSIIDVLAGTCLGIVILILWIYVHAYVDEFLVSGHDVIPYWAGLSLLLCFAYPTPESFTPSFEYHTAFNGVVFGIVMGVQQSLGSGTTDISLQVLAGRTILGLPVILLAKLCSKALAKWLLPILCTTLSVPARSFCYVPGLINPKDNGKTGSSQSGYVNVDTGIRFAQYAGLAWSVIHLAPPVYSLFGF